VSSRKAKVIALALGSGLTTLVGTLTSMVFARVLSMEDLATFRQTLLAYDFATPFLTLGIPGALYYFLPGEEERPRGVILDNMCLLFMMGVIFTVFLLTGGTELLAKRFSNPALLETLPWFSIYPLLTFPVMGLSGVLIIKDRVNLSVVINTVLSLLLTLAVFVAGWITASYRWPLLIKIIFAGFSGVFITWISFHIVKGKWAMPRWDTMWNVLKFAAPLGAAGLLGGLMLQLDKLIVSSMCSPAEFAIYSNGAHEIPFVGMITGSITTVVMVDMVASCKAKKYQEALDLFRNAAVQSALFLLPLMLFLLVFCKDFVCFLYSEKYTGSIVSFVIYLFVLPIRIVVYGSAFVALGITQMVFWRSIGDLLINALLSIVAVWIWGAWGAAIATIVTLYLWTVPFNLFTLGRKFGCPAIALLPWKKLGIILAVSAAAAGLSWGIIYIPCSHLLHLFCGAMVFGIGYLFIGCRLIPELSVIVISYINKIRHKYLCKNPLSM